ncbi:MAG: 4'-phosphopantetheinyl transferase superfamily protein [Myxococcales bacterium]|nr:4'-phosphopantetheinyl transferase superfamily protein [Myxococcales bacterium]
MEALARLLPALRAQAGTDAVVGIGVDVVQLARIVRARSRSDLMRHVCAPEEGVADLDDPTAARIWAGKEAIGKALGSGFWQDGVEWSDVLLGPDLRVRLAGRAAALAAGDRFVVAFAEADGHILAAAWRLRPVHPQAPHAETP